MNTHLLQVVLLLLAVISIIQCELAFLEHPAREFGPVGKHPSVIVPVRVYIDLHIHFVQKFPLDGSIYCRMYPQMAHFPNGCC